MLGPSVRHVQLCVQSVYLFACCPTENLVPIFAHLVLRVLDIVRPVLGDSDVTVDYTLFADVRHCTLRIHRKFRCCVF